MTDETDSIEWPREIWAAEREKHRAIGEHVFSEHATVARFAGDIMGEREFRRYVDADILESAERYYKAKLEQARAELLPWAELGRAVMAGWPDVSDLYGMDLHDLAVEAGVLLEIAGGYDPKRHADSQGLAPEPGDPWYEIIADPQAIAGERTTP